MKQEVDLSAIDFFKDSASAKVPSSKRVFIYQLVKKCICSGRFHPGNRLPTTDSLARHFGASYVTVHSALTDLVRDGWIVRHRGKGTFIAHTTSSPSRPSSTRLVMVLPVERDIREGGSHPIVLEFLRGTTTGASACHAELAIESFPSTPQSTDIPPALARIKNYGGALFLGGQYQSFMQELERSQFPYVRAGGQPGRGLSVSYDAAASLQMAVEHLVQHGYRRLGFLGQTQEGRGRKLTHWKQFLGQEGLTQDPLLVEPCIEISEAYGAARRLLERRPLPEAVFVDNELKAQILLGLAQEHGIRIPGDLALLAYGAEYCQGMAIPSTVCIPYEGIGREAVLLLDGFIRGRLMPPAHKILPPRLAIHTSCGCNLKTKG